MYFQVIYKAPGPDWSMQGGADNPDTDSVIYEDDGATFFYQKWSVFLCVSSFLYRLFIWGFGGFSLKFASVLALQRNKLS